MSATRLAYIAADPESLRMMEIAGKAANASATVLITGESGAGKDHLARWIHEASARRNAPFLKIDSASLPPELVESELFGHERGAFTGAEARKPGRFELAGEGTIVLDEVAALTPKIQAKLLRVLDERKFERLGGTETLEMNSRLIALTNSDLEGAVRTGYFREDLFFRLNVVAIRVPALRERLKDIPPLAEHFLARLAPVHGREGAKLNTHAADTLEKYGWPGNVRELKNAIEHALIFAKSATLGTEDFPSIQPKDGEALPALRARSLKELEKEAIQTTLEETHYKIAQTAKILGISRKTLLEKRKKYGLD